MINRVVVGGRILEEPRVVRAEGGAPYAALSLALKHPRFGARDTEECRVEVRMYGERRVDVAEKFLNAGRDVLFEGHLVRDDAGLRITAEQCHFLERGLVTRYFHQEAFGQVAAA